MPFFLERIPRDRIAVIEPDGGVFSYGRLLDDAEAVGTQIGGRGSLVFCLCENSYACLAGYIGVLSHGGVPLLLDQKLDEGPLRQLMETYSPTHLWLPKTLCGRFPRAECQAEAGDYRLLGLKADFCHLHEDLALLLTTSGSTGSPKLVRQSRKNIEANARAIVEYLEITREDRPITTLPMHYTYGLSILHSHLRVGATILMNRDSIVTGAFWEFFTREGATSFGGVPHTYEMLERLKFDTMELPSLKVLTQAGGKLPVHLHEKYARYARERGMRFYVMYGQTEATARMGYLPWQESLEKLGCMGIAIPGGTFSLLDTDGNEFSEPERVGELLYRGENVSMGYATGPEDLAKPDEWQGVLATGDMAKVDKDGYYTIVGRKKRFLKLFGSRVNLDECEQLIKTSFPGIDCACTGEDDRLLVCITDEEHIREVERYLGRTLGISRSGFRVHHIETLPKTSAGKTDYHNLPDQTGGNPCRT